MKSIRRYGPSMVAPTVTPAPQLGNGTQQALQSFEGMFNKVQEFIRPAVIQGQTAKGEREALAAVEEQGPQFELEQTRGPTTAAGAARSSTALTGGPTRLNAAIMQASKKNGVDPGILSMFATVESGGDLNAQNPNSTAGGPFQLLDSTARAAGIADKTDPFATADWTAGNVRDAQARLRSVLGREPTPGEIYLVHQQGIGGGPALLANPGKMAIDVLAPLYNSRQTAEEAITLNGGRLDMTAGEFAAIWVNKGNAVYNKKSGGAVEQAEFELRTINENTFEPRLPFTVRDAAFNTAADRVIGARASEAMEMGIAAAATRANGNLEVFRQEMAKVRDQVMSQLPSEMPGLRTELEQKFERSRGVAERQAIELAQKRVIAQQTEALTQTTMSLQSEAERIALTGGSAQELAGALYQGQQQIVAYGPREGFTLNGQYYAPDPGRAGVMSVSDMSATLNDIGTGARKIMMTSEFERSAAPGAFVQNFREQVFSGQSPFDAATSLSLLNSFEGQVRANENARRVEVERERTRLAKEATDTINTYVTMTEAGVPVAIPQSERARILTSLEPHPELQRQAEIEFAVADAAVATHGMSGGELLAYVERVRGDMAGAVERGEIDLEGAAVIHSLEDRVKAVQSAVTAEMVGLPMIEQLALSGAKFEDVDYDELRGRAAGNPKVLDMIAEVEAFHRDTQAMQALSAEDRERILRNSRELLQQEAALGEEFGAGAVTTGKVLDRLDEWSKKQATMAKEDPLAFARSRGVTMPSFEGAEDMGQIGAVIADRVNLLQPHAAREGVDVVVPLDQREIDQISELFRGSGRGAQSTFVASIAGLGKDQAEAIFSRVGTGEPALYAAGMVYTGGNKTAAATILRGAVDTKLGGGSSTDVAAARASAIGPLLQADIIAPESVGSLDTVALAYARGMAMAEGGRDITPDDMEAGYQIALGGQENGTGGMQESRYGTTILPAGWRGSKWSWQEGESLEDAIGSITPENQMEILGGMIVDGQGREISPDGWRDSIEIMVPSPDDPMVLIPLDERGGAFIRKIGDVSDVLTIDLRKLQ